ncbi:MAG: type I restriction-modification system endonuclease [Hyphomicrobium sp. 32-62-53]|nr:MAG: type I restriction-modification system endonuclease [Hyphomicrobium sp. 12-62-95]OYX99800.1 MAG: type I restriction-modification system endonuclease [Hyphomicrobium sp. 32-62-53]
MREVASINFDFLQAHADQLVRLAALAEHFLHDDPPTTLTKVRQFSELLARHTAANYGLLTDLDESQIDLLRRLKTDASLPREVLDVFHHLRKIGNTATHSFTGTYEDALSALRLARELSVWFHRQASCNPSFKPEPFVVPTRQPLKHASSMEGELAWVGRANAELSGVQAAALAESKSDIEARISAGQTAAQSLYLDEDDTRRLIDEQLRNRNWEADSERLTYAAGARPQRGLNMAIAEWPTASGPADYALFVGTSLLAFVEAKRQSKSVSAALAQAERYARAVANAGDLARDGGPWGEFKAPFVFATNGRSYLKQLETESGIWFRDCRRAINAARPLTDWYSPEGLKAEFDLDRKAADDRLKQAAFAFGFPLRPYQRKAIEAIEERIAAGQRTLLVAMATGTGKTKLAIALLYRLLEAKRFRRICFVVDRSALGTQTGSEFSSTKVVSGKEFANIFSVKGLGDAVPDPETQVHICTIQGLVKRVLYNSDPADVPPIDQYDLMLIDECHRGYTLDRELSEPELKFRNERDFISKYRRVLEHFDAVKIGLTATPALHTSEIFGQPVYSYSYREAVIDGYLVDHEPPLQIKTRLSEGGIVFNPGDQLELFNTATGQIDLANAPDELKFEVEQFNRQVITVPFNQAVCTELAARIDPYLPGKTLIFAATDGHADIVVDQLKKAYAEAGHAIEDAAIRKITGSVDQVGNLIRSYRNDDHPKIAVTVDLLTTGIDVPKITNLVFLRRVNSRILYEQMLGRATRLCPDLYGRGEDKEVFKIFDAVDLYRNLEHVTAMKPVVANPTISFATLFEELAQSEDAEHQDLVRQQLAVKLRRRLNRLSESARQKYEAEAGETPENTLRRLIDGTGGEIAGWVKGKTHLGGILDWGPLSSGRVLPISSHPDEVTTVTIGYGPNETRPEDYLESFRTFVETNLNQIVALNVVVTRPRDLTRSQLKELRMRLAEQNFSENNLRKAWHQANNEDIAASVVGFIRQAALREPLLPYHVRVRRALDRILKSQQWTDPQRQWLQRIGQRLENEVVLDQQVLDEAPFDQYGGFRVINRAFDGQLESLLNRINDELWKQTG